MKEQSFAIYEMMIGQHPNSQIPPTLEELSLLISSVFLAKRPDLIFLYTNTPAVQSLFQFIPKERVYDVWSPHNSPFSANAVGIRSQYYQKLLISSSTWPALLCASRSHNPKLSGHSIPEETAATREGTTEGVNRQITHGT